MKISLSIEMGEQKVSVNLGFEILLKSIDYSLRDIPENSELFEVLSHHASHNIRSNIKKESTIRENYRPGIG